MSIEITQGAKDALSAFNLPKEEFGFGKIIAPIMLQAIYKNGGWQTPKIIPYGPISFMPTVKVLHYAQEIFEGLKAYHAKGNGPYLFRHQENWKRFNFSAARMAMPDVPEDIFIEGVEEITRLCTDFIPKRSGDSLYIRPFMFSIEESLGIKPSEEFMFLIIASPSGAYFSTADVKVFIEREKVRACPGGTGNAKTGGNYAASLLSAIEAGKQGFQQTLWLDAEDKSNIEEMSGMNFFAVINNELWTPQLTETILDGITRRSIIELAKSLEIPVHEAKMDINWLLKKIDSGECTEAFACGTAVIITPLVSLNEASGETYKFTNSYGPVSKRLRETLLDIQEGRVEAPNKEWVKKID